jgi:cytochrome c oxidase assembly factor 4
MESEPNAWDKRIISTGCYYEYSKLNDCHFDKKDYRKCVEEMENFKICMKKTLTK